VLLLIFRLKENICFSTKEEIKAQRERIILTAGILFPRAHKQHIYDFIILHFNFYYLNRIALFSTNSHKPSVWILSDIFFLILIEQFYNLLVDFFKQYKAV